MPRYLSTDRGPAVIGADQRVGLIDTPAADLGAYIAERDGDLRTPPDIINWVTQGQIKVLAPIRRPLSFWAVGGSYPGHVGGDSDPTHPRFFLVAPSSIIGPGEDIVRPRTAPDQVDYEGEVVVVIGRRMSRVSAADAWSHVAGVTLGNDVSARDVQRGRLAEARGVENVALGKSMDTFSPLGPVLATPDEFDNPDDIGFQTTVDGEIRQKASTSDLFFPVPQLLEFLTDRVTLEPGDLLMTGSPVGHGEPTGRYLREGAVVTISSPVLGDLTNQVV